MGEGFIPRRLDGGKEAHQRIVGRFRERQAVRGVQVDESLWFPTKLALRGAARTEWNGPGLCFRGASPPGHGMGPVKHASGVRLLGKIRWLCVSGISPSVLMCLASFLHAGPAAGLRQNLS